MRRIKHYRLVDMPPVDTVRVGEKDLRLMRAVVRAAEGYRDNTANYQVLLDALDALNAPGKGRK